MTRRCFNRAVALALLLFSPPFSASGYEFHSIVCGHVAAIESVGTNHLSYPPERQVDLLHLKLEVTPDFKNQSVSGTAELRFKGLVRPVDELALDAIDLNVSNVTASRELSGWRNTGKQILLTFAEPLRPGEEANASITYSAEPHRGLYFRTPEMGYATNEVHLFTQGEAIEHRHWFPCYDFPNERFTTEMICHVPAGMVALSNGKLVSREDRADQTVFHWRQDKPHVNYLITLVAGHFEKIEDQHGDLPMAFYTPPTEIQFANYAFKHTKPSMEFFEKEIGVPYPWDRYDQVVVRDFMFGGMENTGQTTLHDPILQPDDIENLSEDHARELIAHELVHHWFGNLVTCKDWNHLWLNEGLTTYFAHLYQGHASGADAMLYDLFQIADNLSSGNDPNPIVSRKFDDPVEMIRRQGHLIYAKGSFVMHMLRAQAGPELFRKAIHTYLEEHAFGVVGTEDLKSAFEKTTSQSWDRFFDQWVYRGGYPHLDVSYSWDERAKLAKVTVRQSQKLSDTVGLFRVPLKVRFTGADTIERTLDVHAQNEDFYISLPAAPQIVRIDPGVEVLARINFNPPAAMLQAMLKDQGDAIGRVIAIQKLAQRGGAQAVLALKNILQKDSFYGCRIEAASGLQTLRSDEALEALIASMDQPDARVRSQTLDAISSFYSQKAYAALYAQLAREKNPAIKQALMRSAATYGSSDLAPILVDHLLTPGYRGATGRAAVEALQRNGSTESIGQILEALRMHEPSLNSQNLGSSLIALAELGRETEHKEEIRQFLLPHAASHRPPVQRSAIRGLGILGDDRSLPILEKLATESPHNNVASAARVSIERIRQNRPVAADLNALRSTVLDLQKENSTMKQEMEDLRRKLEALHSPSEPSPEPAARKRFWNWRSTR